MYELISLLIDTHDKDKENNIEYDQLTHHNLALLIDAYEKSADNRPHIFKTLK